jgi:hypothetical protein
MRKIDLAKITTNYADPAKRLVVIDAEVERVKADNLRLRGSIKENDGRLALLADLGNQAKAEIESAAGRVISKMLMDAVINPLDIRSLDELYSKLGPVIAASKAGSDGGAAPSGDKPEGASGEVTVVAASGGLTELTGTLSPASAAESPVLVKAEGGTSETSEQGLNQSGGPATGADGQPLAADISEALAGSSKRRKGLFGRG